MTVAAGPAASGSGTNSESQPSRRLRCYVECTAIERGWFLRPKSTDVSRGLSHRGNGIFLGRQLPEWRRVEVPGALPVLGQLRRAPEDAVVQVRSLAAVMARLTCQLRKLAASQWCLCFTTFASVAFLSGANAQQSSPSPPSSGGGTNGAVLGGVIGGIVGFIILKSGAAIRQGLTQRGIELHALLALYPYGTADAKLFG